MINSDRIRQVFITERLYQVRSALRLMVVDLHMQVVGEAADWAEALALAPKSHADMLLVHWGLLPEATGSALADFRRACPDMRVVVISGQPTARQAALTAGANAFISKAEAPDRFAEQLLAAANGQGSS
jgi:DNA-binding NarL/FixJ family response regulator